jgi:hypothetical protein
MIELTVCPECDASAEVLWRVTLDSTDGPIEHARVVCLRKHFFWLPIAQLPAAPTLATEPTYSNQH